MKRASRPTSRRRTQLVRIQRRPHSGTSSRSPSCVQFATPACFKQRRRRTADKGRALTHTSGCGHNAPSQCSKMWACSKGESELPSGACKHSSNACFSVSLAVSLGSEQPNSRDRLPPAGRSAFRFWSRYAFRQVRHVREAPGRFLHFSLARLVPSSCTAEGMSHQRNDRHSRRREQKLLHALLFLAGRADTARARRSSFTRGPTSGKSARRTRSGPTCCAWCF